MDALAGVALGFGKKLATTDAEAIAKRAAV